MIQLVHSALRNQHPKIKGTFIDMRHGFFLAAPTVASTAFLPTRILATPRLASVFASPATEGWSASLFAIRDGTGTTVSSYAIVRTEALVTNSSVSTYRLPHSTPFQISRKQRFTQLDHFPLRIQENLNFSSLVWNRSQLRYLTSVVF